MREGKAGKASVVRKRGRARGYYLAVDQHSSRVSFLTNDKSNRYNVMQIALARQFRISPTCRDSSGRTHPLGCAIVTVFVYAGVSSRRRLATVETARRGQTRRSATRCTKLHEKDLSLSVPWMYVGGRMARGNVHVCAKIRNELTALSARLNSRLNFP